MRPMQIDSGKQRSTPIQCLSLALWLDVGAKEELIEHATQWFWPSGCAIYKPEDWHVKLHFIGNVNANQVEDIAVHAGVPFHPFELTLDQPRLWPQGKAVLCASKAPASLWSLYDKLGKTLIGLNLPIEIRRYQPHVTLARRAHAAILPALSTPVVLQARSYALVLSNDQENQRYRVIRQYG
jgi:2'-5' RNA ligase